MSPYSLRALGLDRDELKAPYGEDDKPDWWDSALEMGRAPIDSKFCTARHALFESVAPIGRGLSPVCCHLVRTRAAVLRGDPVLDQAAVRPMGFEAVSPLVKLGASAVELGDLLRSFAGDVPHSAVHVIAIRTAGRTVGYLGALGRTCRYGVCFGHVCVLFGALWSLDWGRVSCMLRGLAPCSQED